MDRYHGTCASPLIWIHVHEGVVDRDDRHVGVLHGGAAHEATDAAEAVDPEVGHSWSVVAYSVLQTEGALVSAAKQRYSISINSKIFNKKRGTYFDLELERGKGVS